MEYDDHEISIVFTDNVEIKDLNFTYRNKEKPTNVLSFPMLENNGEEIALPETKLLGDVVISVETAIYEAEKAGITLEQRISQLLVHGILHLIGYDHEKGEDDFKKMEEKSIELLKLIEHGADLDAF